MISEHPIKHQLCCNQDSLADVTLGLIAPVPPSYLTNLSSQPAPLVTVALQSSSPCYCLLVIWTVALGRSNNAASACCYIPSWITYWAEALFCVALSSKRGSLYLFKRTYSALYDLMALLLLNKMSSTKEIGIVDSVSV